VNWSGAEKEYQERVAAQANVAQGRQLRLDGPVPASSVATDWRDLRMVMGSCCLRSSMQISKAAVALSRLS